MYEEKADYEEYVGDSELLTKFRKWFRAAVESWQKWRDEAEEDYKFLASNGLMRNLRNLQNKNALRLS